MISDFWTTIQPQITKWRQDLHRIPEIGRVEFKTAAYLRNQLDQLGLPWEEIVQTGTYVYLNNQKSSTLAFRSDIDALPISENSGCAFPSQYPGFMHACGHDGHMATLLGFAAWAKDHLSELDYNLLLLFQPAEENVGGAQDIVKSGIFEKYQVERIYGMHVTPDLPEGIIGSRPGPLMAQTGEVHVQIKGLGAHAALAYQGIDSLYIASQLIQQYQGILTRRIPATSAAVLHIGQLISGEAPNVVAHSAKIGGTIRTFSRSLFLEIASHMNELHEATEKAYGCSISMTADPGYPPVINDISLVEKMVIAFQSAELTYQEFADPYFLGEDFSYYQEKIPGVFFFLGIRNDEKNFVHGLHNNQFNFDESTLLYGLKAFIAIAKS